VVRLGLVPFWDINLPQIINGAAIISTGEAITG
jgi:hypothetical protein